MREKVGGVGNQEDEAALDLGEASDVGKLEQQGRPNANNDANEQTAKEDEQEDAAPLEEAEEPVAAALPLVVLLRRLKDDDGNGVVENGLAKDDGVQLRVDLVCVEDGEDSDGIRSRKSGADRDGVDKGHVQRAGDEREQPENQTDDDGRQQGASKGKGQDGADVAEEVGLVQLVAGGENDGREEEVEEDLIVEADQVADRVARGDEEDEADGHAEKDGYDGLVDRRHLFLLEHIASEEGGDEEHDADEERPGGEQLLLR